MKKHILIVDDNRDVRDTIRNALEEEGFVTSTAANGQTLLARMSGQRPDLILLDLVLPDENGLNLLAQIRQEHTVPVIIVSGKGELVDKVLGLEMGAEDYISKPFQIKELIARVKARLRNGPAPQNNSEFVPERLATKTVLRFGNWTLDRERLQVYDSEHKSANLTVKEFRLLEAFISSPNIVLTREQLLDKSRLHDFNVTDRAIDTQIARIRKKLGEEAESGLIQAVRGAGYVFNAEITSQTL
jgi:DNA-binding response OmpR family regulator